MPSFSFRRRRFVELRWSLRLGFFEFRFYCNAERVEERFEPIVGVFRVELLRWKPLAQARPLPVRDPVTVVAHLADLFH